MEFQPQPNTDIVAVATEKTEYIPKSAPIAKRTIYSWPTF